MHSHLVRLIVFWCNFEAGVSSERDGYVRVSGGVSLQCSGLEIQGNSNTLYLSVIECSPINIEDILKYPLNKPPFLN